MIFRHLFTLVALSSTILTRRASAQDSFGEILLQAFTAGIAPSSSVGPQTPVQYPVPTPSELLPEVTPGSVPRSENTPEDVFKSHEPTWEVENETTEFESPSSSTEVELDGEELDVTPSATPVPDTSPEVTFESIVEESQLPTSLEPEVEESPISTAVVVIEDNTFFTPIRVNCGSFDERSTFREDSEKWYNVESLTAEDPFALTRFSSLAEGVLYATYRYAEETLTYTIPLLASGQFELTLHWAEISPFFMRNGARVFKVVVNGKELDSTVDIFAESRLGSFSPFTRTYLVDVLQESVIIQLIKIAGQPMLSAFELLRAE